MSKQFFGFILCCAVLLPRNLIAMEDYYVWDEYVSSEDSAQDRLMMGIENNALNRRCIRELVAEGADIRAYHDYPLRVAASLGHLNMITLLLNEGANIHACDGDVLKRVVASNNDAAVTAILDWSKKENIGLFFAPLVYVLLNELWSQPETDENNPIVLQLAEYLRFVNHNISALNREFLHALTREEHAGVETTLRNGANVLAGDGLALVVAVTYQHVDLVRILLEYAQPSTGGLFPMSVIISSIHLLTTRAKAHEEIFALLKLYLRNNWATMPIDPSPELHAAVMKNDHIVAQRWLLLGADIHYLDDTIMSFACICNYKKIIGLLLQWSLTSDQLYSVNFIRKLITETKDSSPEIAKLLEAYVKDLEIILRPER